ncbi:MAG TPA: hypothetical protein VN736_00445 [Candidatus Limnocylindrales bacterium]|nr:hypothetical protein [Candidatus Limnocylindrales bacterium]
MSIEPVLGEPLSPDSPKYAAIIKVLDLLTGPDGEYFDNRTDWEAIWHCGKEMQRDGCGVGKVTRIREATTFTEVDKNGSREIRRGLSVSYLAPRPYGV